jgi:hypothetical protein
MLIRFGGKFFVAETRSRPQLRKELVRAGYEFMKCGYIPPEYSYTPVGGYGTTVAVFVTASVDQMMDKELSVIAEIK